MNTAANDLYEALSLVQSAAFGLLGVLAVVHWRRRPGPASGWLAATLGSLALVVVIGALLPDELTSTPWLWAGKLLLVVLALFPFLLFRFMSTFVPQPRFLTNTAVTLTAAVAVASLSMPRFPAPGEPLSGPFVGFLVLFLFNWVLLSSLVAVRLWQGGKGQPGVARRRMRMLSLGTVALAVALLVAGIAPSNEQPTPTAFVVQILALFTAPLFLLGFAPPRLFRLAWRREEELALRTAELELMKALDAQRIAGILLPSMCALVGGGSADLRDAQNRIVASHISPASRNRKVSGAAASPAGATLTVSLGSGEITVHATPFTPFFGSEEAQILQSLGVLADLALARADLFRAERRKNTYLRILQQVTASANGPEGPHETIQSALDTVCSETWWSAGHAYMVNPDPSPSEPARIWHLEAASDPSEGSGVGHVTSTSAADGAVNKVLASGESVWVPDVAQDPSFARPVAGHAAAALVPIRVGREVVGVLEFLSDIAHEADQEFLDVLTQIGVQLGRTVERAENQDQLRKWAENLSRSNADLEQFAYVASHDLQEPLRMVSSYMQLLSERYEDSLDETGQRYIHYAVDGANRMQSLVRDLLSFSRVGSRGRDLVPADMNLVLEQTLTDFQVAIEQSDAVVIAEDLPNVTGDPAQLMQLLQNLVGNAIKFHGAAPPEVRIRAERRPGEWLFSVADNGVGFDSKYAERVFVIFKRLHNREDYPGTGIGLAISKKIVERHGGRIWAESEPNRGTTIFFTLPVAGEVAA